MKILQDYRAFGSSGPDVALTIGNFDGVHLGHQALLHTVREVARPRGLQSALLTFHPHPARVLGGREPPPLLVTARDKRRLLAAAGLGLLIEQPFDRALASLTPEAFARDVLAEGLRARHVVVGHDFVFGAKRAGNLETLRRLGATLGFEVDVVAARRGPNGEIASSSRIRELIREGRMEAAAALLGRPYHLDGTVVRGAQRGRVLGFPTANLSGENELVPCAGVYCGWLDWGERPRPAAISVGTNPTFGDTGLSVEAHVLPAFAPPGLDLYGRECHLQFAAHLREQVRFSGPDALADLVRQVHLDIDETHRRLAEATPPASLLDVPGV